MKALIDTNCYTALMRGDEAVAQFLDDTEIVYLSTIVAGELMTGFKGGSMERQNRLYLNEFIRKGGKTIIATVGMETAERFALIKDALKRKGTPIPVNDIWIAAQCMETGAILLSRDQHFHAVDGLLAWQPWPETP
jgi:tRNA(fMet)-specific endonuclease VapC